MRLLSFAILLAISAAAPADDFNPEPGFGVFGAGARSRLVRARPVKVEWRRMS